MYRSIRVSARAFIFSWLVFVPAHAGDGLANFHRDFDQALLEVNEALKSNKSDRTLLLRKGELLIQSGETDEAIRFNKWLTRKFSSEPIASNNLGIAFQANGQPAKAAEQFRKTTRKFPDFALGHENLGNTLTAMASAAFAAAAAVDENNAKVAAKANLAASLDLLAARSLEVNAENKVTERNSKSVAQQVVNTMHSWINARNRKDLNTWLSHYSSDFQPDNDRSLAEWVDRSKRNFAKSDYFKVYLDSLEVSRVNNNLVSVRFRELFESDAFESVSDKEILVKKERSSWLIVSESHL